MVNGRAAPPPPAEAKVQTRHVREMAANLVLWRALHALDAAGGIVRYRDADGDWNRDQFVLPQRPDRLQELAPLLEALVEWVLHSEQAAVVGDLAGSRWSRHLLRGADPPAGSAAAVPLAQRGAIWGALAVYRPQPAADSMELRRKLAELATEPLSSLDSGRPEGVG
jgi:GAF domain-containing protein